MAVRGVGVWFLAPRWCGASPLRQSPAVVGLFPDSYSQALGRWAWQWSESLKRK
ncbi:MAG: hypothetical protein PUP92_38105 [Rhizonema sp. PD38]|nr:hypothetical protein [Rhizonema sp. PD38]